MSDMRKALSSICLLWLLSISCALLSVPAFAISSFSLPRISDYDDQNQPKVDYDVGRQSDVGYDAVLDHLTHKNRNGTTGRRVFSTKLANLVAAETTAVRWGRLNGPGPVGEAVANTFRGGSYTERVLSQETTLYRVYGGNAGEVGSYWTRTVPTGPLQSTMDSALNPAWGNTAQNVATMRVPSGMTIYEGLAAPQGGLLGGGSQVYIPRVNPNWLVHP